MVSKTGSKPEIKISRPRKRLDSKRHQVDIWSFGVQLANKQVQTGYFRFVSGSFRSIFCIILYLIRFSSSSLAETRGSVLSSVRLEVYNPFKSKNIIMFNEIHFDSSKLICLKNFKCHTDFDSFNLAHVLVCNPA